MSSANQPAATAYRPVFYIGLGGTGKEVLLRLRLRLFERFRTYKVPFARFVWIDTDTRATDARGADLSGALASMGFDDTEKYGLLKGSVGKDLTDVFENPYKWPHIHEWLYPQVQRFGGEIADGAGGVRAVGRLTLFAKYAGLRETLERKLNELSRLETIGETQEFFKEHKLPAVNTDGSSAPVVCVVTSLAGGTGCGTFLDIGFLLRDIKKLNLNIADIFSYAVLPNVYNASAQGELPLRSYANAYAALKELDHFTKRVASRESQDAKEGNPYSDYVVSWEPGRERRIEGPPYSANYLIESTNEANLAISLENRGDLFSMLAETLLLDLLPGPFSDAKRSNYSNIVQALSGPAGANTARGAGSVRFTQAFARRYASCGMSKIEIPLDTVRGACSSQLTLDILDYVNRTREDAHVGRDVPRDLAASRLDKDGILNEFGNEWKKMIGSMVEAAMGAQPMQKPEDAQTLRAALDKVERQSVAVDSSHTGDSVRWMRQRTPTVNNEVQKRWTTLVRDSILENPERGLLTALRRGGYFELLLQGTRALLDPSQAGAKSVFDALMQETVEDAAKLRALKEYQLRELEVALRSLPARLLGAREQLIKVILARLRDAEEQYLFTLAEEYLLVEARNVARELLSQMQGTRDALSKFLQKAETMRGSAQARLETFHARLRTGSHVLFLQLFDFERDLPQFYKLGLDQVTQQPGQVDARREYEALLREFGVQNGLAGLAEVVSSRTTSDVNRKVEEFCDRRFYEDFIAHPRPVSILEHPLLRDPARARQTIQNFVNHARPMLRRDEKMAASEVESTTFAYLGVADPKSPAAVEFAKEISNLMPERCKLIEPIDTGKPNEIYLYFSSFAFPLPAVSLVQNECHKAYTDFYAQFHPGEAYSRPAAAIPLHLSKRWEGRFDDLVIYSDRDAQLLEEVLTVVNLAPPLRVLSVGTNAESGLTEFFYKEAPPFNKLRSLSQRRNLISNLMADGNLRSMLTHEVQRREAALTPAQLHSFFWALQAQYLNPSLEQDTPDSQLLRRKVQEVFDKWTALRRTEPEGMPVGDLEAMPHSGQFRWLRAQNFGLTWENGDQPVVDGLDVWRKP